MPLQISRLKALLFDVDGTLRDTDDRYVARLARLFRPFRRVLPYRDEHKFARSFVMRVETPGNFLFGIPDRLHIDDEIAGIGAFLHRRGLGRRENHDMLVPGTRQMLQALQPRYALAVVSARPKIGTLSFIEHFDLTPYFSCIAHGQSARRTKPYPDPILWAAAQLGVAAEDCLMIGDSTVDVRAGSAAGTQTVGVLCGFGEREELLRAGADLILPAPADLTSVLL